MRSLTFFWVIMMMTMSITSVIAQNSIIVDYETIDGKENQRVVPSEQKKTVSITYSDKSKPQIPESLLGQYVEKGEVSFCGKKKITGYSDLIFSVKIETLQETWTKTESGVMYSTRVVLGKQTAWWMILSFISIFLMIVAQRLENTTASTVAFAAAFAIFAAAPVVAAAPFAAAPVAFTAFALVFAPAFAAAEEETIEDNFVVKKFCVFFYVCMILFIILMYCAF